MLILMLLNLYCSEVTHGRIMRDRTVLVYLKSIIKCGG